jgi:hypothetical protein
MSPEASVGPLQQAPADRPSLQLEDLLQQVLAVIFGDRRLDQNERRVLRDFMEEVALRAQNGGIGMGGTPPAEAMELPPSPMEMNMATEDMGTVAGAQPEYEEGY